MCLVAKRIHATLGLTLVPCLQVLVFILGVATVATLFAGFDDYELMMNSWNAKPITNITLISSNASCASNSALLFAQRQSNSKSPLVRVSNWRGRQFCLHQQTALSALQRPDTCSNTTICGNVACLLPCPMGNKISMASMNATLDLAFATENQVFPIVQLVMTNETLNVNRYRVLDSVSETDLFAWNNVRADVPRSATQWRLYYLNEIPWGMSSTCFVTRNDLVKRRDYISSFSSTQYAAFGITVLSVVLLAACIPLCLICNGKLVQIWKPEQYEQGIQESANALEQYCTSNPNLWNEYRVILEQRSQAQSGINFKVRQNTNPENDTPLHLHQMEILYKQYTNRAGSKSCIQLSETLGSCLGSCFNVLSYILTIVAVYYAMQVKDYLQLVATQQCGDTTTNTNIQLIASKMASTTTWMNIVIIILTGITIPVHVITCLCGCFKLVQLQTQAKKSSVEYKLAQVLPA